MLAASGRPPDRSVLRALPACDGGLQRAATGCQVKGKSCAERTRGSGALELERSFPKLCSLLPFQVTNQVSERPPRPQPASAGRGAGGSTWPSSCLRQPGDQAPVSLPQLSPQSKACVCECVTFVPPPRIALSTLHRTQ